MAKFFHLDLLQVCDIEKLIIDRDTRREIVLNQGNGFADVVRFNSRYNEAVLVTIPVDQLKQESIR